MPASVCAAVRRVLAVASYMSPRRPSLTLSRISRTLRTTKMRFHIVMMLIVILVSLSMHGMASAAPAAVSSTAFAPAALQGGTPAEAG